METFDMIWFIAYYLLLIWIAITIGWFIKKLLDIFKTRTNSRVELEHLQKVELEKRIAILEKQLAEKED